MRALSTSSRFPNARPALPVRRELTPRGAPRLRRSKGIPVSESMRLGGHLPTAAFSLLSLSVGAALPEPDVWVEDGCASCAPPRCAYVGPAAAAAERRLPPLVRRLLAALSRPGMSSSPGGST